MAEEKDLKNVTDYAEMYQIYCHDADGHPGVSGREKPFDETRMMGKISEFAEKNHLEQTQRALLFAKEKHEGQYRKGSEKVPYIVHPLNVAYHAMSLGITDDRTLAAALLHDICEDCDILPEELPVDQEIQHTVSLLTFSIEDGETRKSAKERYYMNILSDREAVMVKLIDRCNNVSFMTFGFTRERMKAYIEETRVLVIPMIKCAREKYPEYTRALYLLKYHILSVINSIDVFLN